MSAPLKISVLLPVYNVADYISECLDALLSQTWRDMEIVIVDDGSTDDTYDICRRYSGIDGRIRLYRHKVNKGVAATRNSALGHATGDYIAFVDGDDVVDTDYLSELVSGIMAEHVDISCVSYRSGRLYTGFPARKKGKRVVAEACDALESMLYREGWFDSSLWGKLIRRNLFDGLPFREGIIYEDLDVMPRLLMRSRKVSVSRSVLYFHRQWEGSLLSRFSDRRLDVLDVTARICDMVDRECPALRKAAADRCLSAAFNMLALLSCNGMENSVEAGRCYSLIVSHRSGALLDARSRLRNKAASTVSFAGRRILIFLFSALRYE